MFLPAKPDWQPFAVLFFTRSVSPECHSVEAIPSRLVATTRSVGWTCQLLLPTSHRSCHLVSAFVRSPRRGLRLLPQRLALFCCSFLVVFWPILPSLDVYVLLSHSWFFPLSFKPSHKMTVDPLAVPENRDAPRPAPSKKGGAIHLEGPSR